ncbi:MAG: hypothetical protein EPO19_05950 [Betaproteobacteria bacterium]|nr:MAG: hypothetical protein EPO19_05950 [Betaproteobacteria bacterium]
MGESIKVALFGASGRTGQAVARAGAAQGLLIRASLRETTRAILPSTVEIIRGDLGDANHVRDTIAGTIVVCCVFGPGPPYTDVFCARATELIVNAMHRVGVRRLICQTGAMIGRDVANWTLPVCLMVRMFRWQRPAVAADRTRQEELIRESDLEWTLVKPPRLTDGPARGRVLADVDTRIGLLSKISRADLASFLVGECVAPRYLKQAVYVTW